MNWKTIGVFAVVVAGLLALACTETTVLSPGSEGTTGISVNGTGSVFGEPDVAVLTLGVEAQADSVGDARAQAAEAMAFSLLGRNALLGISNHLPRCTGAGHACVLGEIVPGGEVKRFSA